MKHRSYYQYKKAVIAEMIAIVSASLRQTMRDADFHEEFKDGVPPLSAAKAEVESME